MKKRPIPSIGCLSLPVFVAILAFSPAHAQSLLTRGIYSAGDYATNGSNNASFTVGEAVTGFIDSNGGQLNQGQQQNFKALLVTKITEVPRATSSVKAWPNPASEVLNVAFSPEVKIASAELFDVSGKLLKTEVPAAPALYQLVTGDLAPGAYLLVFRHAPGEQTTVRFVKSEQ